MQGSPLCPQVTSTTQLSAGSSRHVSSWWIGRRLAPSTIPFIGPTFCGRTNGSSKSSISSLTSRSTDRLRRAHSSPAASVSPWTSSVQRGKSRWLDVPTMRTCVAFNNQEGALPLIYGKPEGTYVTFYINIFLKICWRIPLYYPDNVNKRAFIILRI